MKLYEIWQWPRTQAARQILVPPPLKKPILHHHRRHIDHTFFWTGIFLWKFMKIYFKNTEICEFLEKNLFSLKYFFSEFFLRGLLDFVEFLLKMQEIIIIIIFFEVEKCPQKCIFRVLRGEISCNFLQISRNFRVFNWISVVYLPKLKSKMKFSSIPMFTDDSKIAIFFAFFLEGNQGKLASIITFRNRHFQRWALAWFMCSESRWSFILQKCDRKSSAGQTKATRTFFSLTYTSG